MSYHTILVLDPGGDVESVLQESLSGELLRYRYVVDRYPPAVAPSSRFVTDLATLLNLEPGLPRLRFNRMLRLRAVVLDWSTIPAAGDCCRLVRERRPNMPLFLVFRNIAILPAALPIMAMPWVYACAGDDWGKDLGRSVQLHLSEFLDEIRHAPYWAALQAVGARPPVSFHALPIGSGQSSSASIADFIAAFGRDRLAVETSLGNAPLDSLLNPSGPLLQAQRKAAIAFGADAPSRPPDACRGTLFVTTGTSAANRIVISAFALPDDYVLVDRSCHISHHSALACAYARPILMRPFCNYYGISGPVSLETIGRALWHVLTQKHRVPSLIILSNPTFDGIYYRPELVVRTIHRVLADYWRSYRDTPGARSLWNSIARFQPRSSRCGFQEKGFPDLSEEDYVAAALRGIVLLFDEAWSAYAFFHPHFIDFSALHAAASLADGPGFSYRSCLRVYCTQSTHKTLSALRQGSMIHYRDPLLADLGYRDALIESYRAHATTSPSSSILASLDVARRQAQLEGTRLIDRALRLAEAFRYEYPQIGGAQGRNGFFALSAETMMTNYDSALPGLSPEQFALAPTHVSISWRFVGHGVQVRRLLLENGIQVNKCDARSVLAIFHIGVDADAVVRLKDALRLVRDELLASPPAQSLPLWRQPAWQEFEELYGDRDSGFWFKNLGRYPRRLIDVDDMLSNSWQDRSTGTLLVAATFVTTYPPGFPVLVPGQVLLPEHLQVLKSLGYSSIYGGELVNGRLRISVLEVS